MKRIIEVSFALAAIAAVPAIVMAQTSIQELQRKNSITISGRIVRIFRRFYSRRRYWTDFSLFMPLCARTLATAAWEASLICDPLLKVSKQIFSLTDD